MLSGEGLNTRAYGAKAMLTMADGSRQYQELYPVRGYQSTMAPELFFGFPSTASIRQLTILWPSGKETLLTNVQPDQVLQLQEKDAAPSSIAPAAPTHRIFTDITRISGLDFKHKENDFVDFKEEVLLYERERDRMEARLRPTDKPGLGGD